MEQIRRFAFVALIATVTPSALAAQADTVYVGTKSRFAAGALEYLIPTTGFAYADDWSRGFVPNAFRVGGIVLAWDEITSSSSSIDCEGQCAVGLLMALGGTIWAIVDATKTARDHNQAVLSGRMPPGLQFAPGPDGSLAVGWRMPLGN